MEPTLLATKIRPPTTSNRLLRRPALIDRLESEVPDHRLTLVAAPAGYGKTSLLAQWAEVSCLPIAWLTLDDNDGDFKTFFRYLVAAWEQLQPQIRDSRLGVLQDAADLESADAVAAIVNTADQLVDDLVIVIDDFHLITDPALLDRFRQIIDNIPARLHFVIASRAVPELPLARYRARGELLELWLNDLRFSEAESSAVLRRLANMPLTDEQLGPLHRQLEGWAAGLQLAASSLRRGVDVSRLGCRSGRNRNIADYLQQDVFAHLPVAVQRFLLETSILDNLSDSLCNAVTSADDARAMLDLVEQENLFLQPLDEERRWYRYHRLFRDFLRSELDRSGHADIERLHRRAGEWYFAHQLPDQAFEHAIAGRDSDLTLRIFERYLNVKLNGGELKQVLRWLEALPSGWYDEYPLLHLYRGATLAMSGDFANCLRCVELAEQGLSSIGSEDRDWQLAIVTAVRCFIACVQNDLQQAEIYADQSLNALRAESQAFRASIYHALGDTYRRNARWDKAQECYSKVLPALGSSDFRLQAAVQAVHVYGALADLEMRRGCLRSAEDYWQMALEALNQPESRGRLDLPIIGWLHIRAAEVLYEWNRLDDARARLASGLRYVEVSGDRRTMVAGQLLAGRLYLTHGDVQSAADALEQVRPALESAELSDWREAFERLQVDVWLGQSYRDLRNWSERAQTDGLESLAVPRALLLAGGSKQLVPAQSFLERALARAEADGRSGAAVEIRALQALLYQKLGDTPQALRSLSRALRDAEVEGFVRTFVDLGAPMLRLLQEVDSRSGTPAFAKALLDAFDAELAMRATPDILPEPLTGRELEVLQLLAAGMTNPEIGDMLYISSETVKKHAGSIYGKLDVHNRTAAAARARDLGLIE